MEGMPYVTLHKLYYQDPDRYETTYQQRYTSPFTRHFPFSIRAYHRPRAYEAFLCYPEELLQLTERIGSLYADLLQLLPSIPQPARQQFQYSCIVEEVQSTNEIEGVYSTRKEIRDILSGKNRVSRQRSLVQQYVDLAAEQDFSLATCADLRALYDRLVAEEVYAEAPDEKLDGRWFRKESVDVVSGTGKVVHQGLYPEEKIIEALETALKVLHDKRIPILLRIALFHYFFAYIHPFYDGNGRTDRFITSWLLGKRFQVLPALRLSVVIRKQKKEYYRLFAETNEEANRGDLTPFVLGFLQLIAQAFDETLSLLQQELEQLEIGKSRLQKLEIQDPVTRSLAELLLEATLFGGEGLTMEQLCEQSRKSRMTVQKRLDAMPEGLLTREKNGKAWVYRIAREIR